MDSKEEMEKTGDNIEKELENFRQKTEDNFNGVYNKLNNKKLSEENEENLSLALTMMESIGIDILHLLRDYDELIDYLEILKKL